MFIFGRCHCSWAAVTPAKYECDQNNIFGKSAMYLTKKLTTETSVPPTLIGIPSPAAVNSHPFQCTLAHPILNRSLPRFGPHARSILEASGTIVCHDNYHIWLPICEARSIILLSRQQKHWLMCRVVKYTMMLWGGSNKWEGKLPHQIYT